MLIINAVAAILLLCIGSADKVGNVIYHLTEMTVSSATMPYGSWYSPAAYDTINKRIWLIGGSSYYGYAQTAVQYYNVESDTTGLVNGASWGGNVGYNTNSMIYDRTHKKLWYAAYYQMCYFDIQTLIGFCGNNYDWYYPTGSYAPSLVAHPYTTNLLYVVSNYYSFWRFDVNQALANNYPWRTGPDQQYYRYDYPCATFYRDDDQDYVYIHGGSYETTATERINVTDTGFGDRWRTWGGLVSYMYYAGCSTFDRLVYVFSGEQDYSYSNNIMVYDMKTGKSRLTNVYLNRGRLFMGTATAALSSGTVMYVLNGQLYNYYYYYDSFLSSVEYSNPMTLPTPSPTESPTRHPTKHPTEPPTRHPTRHPTNHPTRHPTNAPSRRPSKAPTNKPTKVPTKKPTTRAPTKKPTHSPTRTPTYWPTRHPTRHPTGHPTGAPTARPLPQIEVDFTITFDFWLKSWTVSDETFNLDPTKKPYVTLAAHDALADTIQYDIKGLPSYWRDLFTVEATRMENSFSTGEGSEKATQFVMSLKTGTSQLNTLITDVLSNGRKIKSVSKTATTYLTTDFDDSSMQAYYNYNGLTGESLDTPAPTPAPAAGDAAFTAASDDSVMNKPWFWIVVIVCILVLFFGAMGLYLRHSSKKDKLRRQQNMMAIQKLASLSGGVPMSPLQAQQQQALTHALWLGGGGTGGTNTNSAGEAGENGGEGAGNHTQLLNDMLSSKLKAQQANQASLAMGGGSSGGMGMGMAPMGMNPMGMGMGMNPMGMGMNPMGMGMGMAPPQFYNSNSIAGDLNNYMFNPAMMNMGMNWQEMAQMVAWQNQMLMAQANGKSVNPAMLSTDALNIGGEDANGVGVGGGENEDPNASNKLLDAMKLNTSENGEKVQDFEE